MRAHTPAPVPATAPSLPWLAPPTIAEPAVPTVTLDGSVKPDHAPIFEAVRARCGVTPGNVALSNLALDVNAVRP